MSSKSEIGTINVNDWEEMNQRRHEWRNEWMKEAMEGSMKEYK